MLAQCAAVEEFESFNIDREFSWNSLTSQDVSARDQRSVASKSERVITTWSVLQETEPRKLVHCCLDAVSYPVDDGISAVPNVVDKTEVLVVSEVCICL